MLNAPTNNKTFKPLPFAVYFVTVLFLTVAGLIISIYLSISHYRVYTDIGFKSFCAISRAINCDTVSQSPYSILFGVPVPIWGIIGYALILLLLPFAWSDAAEKKRIWSLLFLVSLIYSIYSLILAGISTYFIHSYCIMCILTYGINLLLLFYTWIIRKRFAAGNIKNGFKHDLLFLWNQKVKSAVLLVPYLAAVVLVVLLFPVYWSFEPPVLSANFDTGVTENGHPWIGSESAEITIMEFTDYQCFQCNKLHFFLRQLMVDHPGKIKLIHRHFPMDHSVNPLVKEPLHVGSGAMALLVIYAGTQNKFWQMNDLVFSIARGVDAINVKELAGRVELNPENLPSSMYDAKIRHILETDIAEGIKLGVRGTPTFIINGNLYRGQIPQDIIRNILKE